MSIRTRFVLMSRAEGVGDTVSVVRVDCGVVVIGQVAGTLARRTTRYLHPRALARASAGAH